MFYEDSESDDEGESTLPPQARGHGPWQGNHHGQGNNHVHCRGYGRGRGRGGRGSGSDHAFSEEALQRKRERLQQRLAYLDQVAVEKGWDDTA